MTVAFEFATARRIVFARGAATDLPDIVRAAADPLPPQSAHNVFVVTGRDPDRSAAVLDAIETDGTRCTRFPVASEPTVEDVRAAATMARDRGCGIVLGFGGGSALDLAKAVAALIANRGDVLDYLEVVGHGRPLARPAAPCIAVPTTAGTGSEVTRNAVVDVRDRGVKVSMRSLSMLPTVAVVDPELTVSLPPEVTAATGLDALTQLLEAFVSLRAHPLADAICREGIARAADALPRAVRDGNDPDARESMSLAALFGGLALANAGLGAVHGFAGPVGGMIHAPHGAVCAAFLPHVTAANIRALRERAPHAPALHRYAEVARIVTGRSDADAEDLADWTARFRAAMPLPRLADLGMTADHVPDAVDRARRAGSMRGNPIELTEDELRAILARALAD